jgi:thioredoxin-like negative regulator of GroEL
MLAPPLDRILILVGLVAIAVVATAAVRWWARGRLRRLQATGSDQLWQALAVQPDGRPSVVAFSSPGCAACHHAQAPALRALQDQQRGQVRVIAVDVSERPAVATAFGVLTVPSTVILGASGRVVTANHGFASAARLAEQLREAAVA